MNIKFSPKSSSRGGTRRRGSTRAYGKTRRRRYKRGVNQVVSYKSPVPFSFKTKMKFAYTVRLNPGATAPGFATISANGIYQPLPSGATHQPLGFDQLMALYDHYHVLGSRVTAEFVPGDRGTDGLGGEKGAAIVGIQLADSATPITTFDNCREQTNSISSVVVGDGNGYRKLMKNYSGKQFHNVQNVKDNDDLRGSLTSNPSEQAYFHIWARPTVSGSDPGTVDVVILMEYIVLFTEQISLAQSVA